ncbi:hypothetical protein [Leisingera methylohalidivorans]|uniref:hypothetical protein n=1 Tax=Leisingera methylohalidivorans TaxID=133924 RepID=UPI003CCB8C38
MNVRFGLDTNRGSVQGVGDAAVVFPAVWLCCNCHVCSAHRRTIARMALNTAMDNRSPQCSCLAIYSICSSSSETGELRC